MPEKADQLKAMIQPSSMLMPAKLDSSEQGISFVNVHKRYSALSIHTMMWHILMLFPITTLLQSVPGFSIINQALFGCYAFLFVLTLLRNRISRSNLMLLMGVLTLSIWSFAVTGEAAYNANLYFYLPFWVIFLSDSKERYYLVFQYFPRHKRYVLGVCLLWTMIVGLSIFDPSAYVYKWGEGRYFVSITGNSFRLAPTALMILALILFYIQDKKRLSSLLLCVVPTYSLIMCGSRTYFGIGMLLVCLIWLYWLNSNVMFWISIVPLGIIMIYIAMQSAFGDKVRATAYGANPYMEDFWGSITNGRSIFWFYDMEVFFKQPLVYQLLGKGYNFVYNINLEYYGASLWAHNDFINILMNYGYAGMILYLYPIFSMIRMLKKTAKRWISKALFVLIWLINAMFNMNYTYFCAVIALPIICLGLDNRKAAFDHLGNRINAECLQGVKK